ncbi:MAG: tRNA (adenosine(37)-N6)-threonylcarbamoyltransferase complex transferase subunit TsaD [Clostridia bacterium]|nr:tRNA (adenosine(37)-N6)-threonylcarbamoyltransferase complex transferase subunit TsaD [Clostridia bacterium]
MTRRSQAARGRLVLGLETSCDETAAALVGEDGRVAASVVASQAALHSRYGGVVPELAARRHAELLVPVVRAAFDEAGSGWADVAAIAVTRGPGLVGALLVGVAAAKAMAYARGLPLVGVNHLAGHVMAALLGPPEGERAQPAWPAVALVVSGSHTDLLRIAADPDDPSRPGELRRLGATRDDAAGEAFDKVARLLGLGYPGGPAIERAAEEAGPKRAGFALPRPMRREGYDFSFSGLKTAVALLWEEAGRTAAGRGERLRRELAREFQEAVVDVLVEKTMRAADEEGARSVVLSGGVARNGRLRARLAEACAARGLPLAVPPPRYCTDNAAMIALAAHLALARGRRDSLDLDADPDLDFEEGPLAAWA